MVEIASNSERDKRSRERDYSDKWLEYAQREVPEYWIIDPTAGVVVVLSLDEKIYQEIRFTGNQAIDSPTFPLLKRLASEILRAGDLGPNQA